MGTTPDELRNDVEERRAHLARNVDRLADRITPGRVARRKADSIRHQVSGVKERVMGSAHDSAHGASEGLNRAASSVADTAREAGGNVSEAVQQAPERVRRQTQGSPLAAGLIAFGAGMLASALLPTTEAEERLGQQLKEHSDELLEPVKRTAVDAAQEVREELRGPAADAVESVKSTAQEAVGTTKEHARDAGRETARELRQVGRDAADDMKHTSGGGRTGR